ncbi:acetyltransferase (GNAT) family protein [Palleronia aestuarii]|uniref:Acetyltransferase (GNAT) family protein n=1 Tax=Palleronia aestuarii TaxID=568105 RepID=A0A2W7NWL6_9RHOB|nr:GNAT family N-acetyltransferase [Palleronia aestuarii]PZX17696.1 acetyltransferase (GNAT) family protein [Palleronia aestuarii]
MSAKLRIATTEDSERLLKLVLACHAETDLPQDEAAIAEALRPLLEGGPNGVVYLIGPPSSPVGYLAISFGYSISIGGLEGHIDEIYIRPPVRNRGMASEALHSLAASLSSHGVRALHFTQRGDDSPRVFGRQHFRPSKRGAVLTRML